MTEKHNVLIIGGGGREHALALSCLKSAHLDNLIVNPGNGGISDIAECFPTPYSEYDAWKAEVKKREVSVIIIGPEQPLVDGLVDRIKADVDLENILIVGPKQEAAQLEGSKAYAKDFMVRHGVPTAVYGEFTAETEGEAHRFLETMSAPYVLKADGLAAGKGVLILDTLAEAKDELSKMFSGKFGQASKTVVIEEFLDGVEFSVFALFDSSGYKILPVAKDYKRIGEGDTGLNTGGMGSVSPVPFVDDAMMTKVIDDIVEPTFQGIKLDGLDYQGFLFFGLIDVDGSPKVIEYNCRMGDPETQSVLPRIDSDFLAHCLAVSRNRVTDENVVFSSRSAATVMTTSGGYPEAYQKGKVIQLPELASEDHMLIHSGTARSAEGLITSGGRVIAATALGANMDAVIKAAQSLADDIRFEGKYYRSDIGKDIL